MATLAVNDRLDFNSLKEYLELTDGNLATHLKALEKEAFVGVEKSFIGRKPHTNYHMTEAGRKAFQDHLEALEELIKSQKEAQPERHLQPRE